MLSQSYKLDGDQPDMAFTSNLTGHQCLSLGNNVVSNYRLAFTHLLLGRGVNLAIFVSKDGQLSAQVLVEAICMDRCKAISRESN